MSVSSMDAFELMVCPVTDEGCDQWTKACNDNSNPVDYSIMRELQDPVNAEASRKVGKLCFGRYEGKDTCGIDVMVQIRTGQYEQGALDA